MPHRRTAGLSLLAALLISNTALGSDPDIELALLDSGEVRLAPQTLAPSDYVVAVYAERLQDLPVPAEAVPETPGTLAEGCLPVVRIETASGRPTLPKAAELTFGCADLPANARIHAWMNGQWHPVPTRRLPDGRALAHFTKTAIYGLFIVGDVPRI